MLIKVIRESQKIRCVTQNWASQLCWQSPHTLTQNSCLVASSQLYCYSAISFVVVSFLSFLGGNSPKLPVSLNAIPSSGRLKNIPPKRIHVKVLWPAGSTLLGKKTLEDMSKWKISRQEANPELSGWSLTAVTRILIKERWQEIIDHHSLRRRLCEDGGRDGRDAATRCGTPRNASS